MSELDLQDAILRTALELQRLSAHEENEAEAILLELERELKQLLATSLDERTKAAIADLIKQAETAIDARYAAASEVVDTHGLVLLVSERTVETLHLIAPSVVKPTVETLASLSKNVLIDGAPSAAWWSKQAEDTAFKFAAAVRQGVVNGETNEQIVARITARAAEPGFMQIARRNARALVHSSIMSAANDARMATYRKNGALLQGVRWLATLDGHTCPRCAALDGQSWDLDGHKLKSTKVEFKAPPIHWNDRCVLSPIAKSFRDIGLDIDEPDAGERASSEGPVHGATTFNDFLKRQSPAFIERVLGKERARLFIEGKITVRDLVSGTGRELTLEELKG
jgi:SPP1 gp7 family putative phage head morphogenesis protein